MGDEATTTVFNATLSCRLGLSLHIERMVPWLGGRQNC